MVSLEKFTRFVYKTPSCWFWIGRLNFYGYGVLAHEGAHRWAWRFFKGAIPLGQHVLHTCDTPQCVNPDHLFLGDAKTNALDAARKGRKGSGKGLATRCIHGHLLKGKNVLFSVRQENGELRRHCRTCNRFYPSKRKGRKSLMSDREWKRIYASRFS
jgi:HNH endonuclease